MVMKGYLKGKAEGIAEFKEEMELRILGQIIKIYPNLSDEQATELLAVSIERLNVLRKAVS